MEWTTSLHELTTGVTDALLGAVALTGARWLRTTTPASAPQVVWVAALVLFGGAATSGFFTHALVLPGSVAAPLGQLLYLLLGPALALFVVGAIASWRGPDAARRALAPMLGAAAVFFVATQLAKGSFVVFLAFEAAAILFALAIYGRMAAQGDTASRWITAGLVTSLLAGWVQSLGVIATYGWPLDNNGCYHVVQLAGILMILRGLKAGSGQWAVSSEQ